VPTHPRYKTIDTLKWAKKFYFNSNKLDYIGQYLGLGNKLPTGIELWKAVVLDNDREALEKMAEYCRRDVQLLEKVYTKMADHMPHATHQGVLAGGDKWTCPHCGSEKVRLKCHRVTSSGTRQCQMQCQKCGRYHTISEKSYRDYQEATK
jgi:RNase P subunit RPR2